MEDLEALRERLSTERPDGWDDLPDIPLYMDQVVSYLARQLITFEEGDSLTSAMINNYIKEGLVSRANGKKYDQEHLAYLTFISALKHVLSVREMRAIEVIGRENWNTEKLYDFFCEKLDSALNDVADSLDVETSDHDMPKLVATLGLRSYAYGLACREALAILCRRAGRGDLLKKK